MTSTEENTTIIEEKKPAPIIFGDESLSDMTLVVDDQDFKIHKMVLASRSDVFKAMFYGEFKESKEDRVEIKDVSVNNFRRFLEIIYTGKTSDPQNFLEFPFKADDHFSIYIGQSKEYTDVKSFYHDTRSYETFFHYFWKDTTEILNTADRFNLTHMVKGYIETVTTAALQRCRNGNCYQCFNSFMFALVNEIDVSECQKKYPMSQYQSWANYAIEEPFPDVSKKAVNILMNRLSK